VAASSRSPLRASALSTSRRGAEKSRGLSILRARVLDGLINEAHVGASADELDHVLKNLRPRWFVTRNAHTAEMVLMQPRWAMTFMRGPMTRAEIRRGRAGG
jgi:hypothetical protein